MSHWQHSGFLTLKYTTKVKYIFKICFKYNWKGGSEGDLSWIFWYSRSFSLLNLSPKYDEHHPKHFVSENFQEDISLKSYPIKLSRNQLLCKGVEGESPPVLLNGSFSRTVTFTCWCFQYGVNQNFSTAGAEFYT